MMIVRPIEERDRSALWKLAQQTGGGFTSLQPDRPLVDSKLDRAIHTFNEAAKHPDHLLSEEGLFLFVMEDTEAGEIAGVCAIESEVGMDAPWYNYKVTKQVHSSRQLNVFNMMDVLVLCNEHTGMSELCTLFLLPDYRKDKNGPFLSKSRMLFLSAFPQLFHEYIFAEMRGYSDENAYSPFWEGLGRHFFAVDFIVADQQSSVDKAFIAELMPRHPIYTHLLPEDAQVVIGQTHESTTPARRLLEDEGFRYTGYVDIFDGGPVLETRVEDIRAVRDSRRYTVKISPQTTADRRHWLMTNAVLPNYRCILGHLMFENLEFVCISQDQADALQVSDGDTLLVTPLRDTPI